MQIICFGNLGHLGHVLHKSVFPLALYLIKFLLAMSYRGTWFICSASVAQSIFP